MRRNCVILVPGLGDNIYQLQWVQKLWKRDGITVFIHTAPWKNTKEPLTPKVDRLLHYIDTLYKKGYKISLIGTSAGGSLVINAYTKRRSKIHKVISVCGRVRKGKNVFPTLEAAAKGFPAFTESVLACEKEIKNFTVQDKKKIMTVSPWPFDGIVPLSCIPITGATNITIPIPFHMFGIGAALTLFRNQILSFITH